VTRFIQPDKSSGPLPGRFQLASTHKVSKEKQVVKIVIRRELTTKQAGVVV
jgi:hypothetical protein